MQIIPVLDLRAGALVRAHASLRRADYPLLRSTLCPDASPELMLEAIARTRGTRTVYVADLDALEGNAPQQALLLRLSALHPGIEFWCDLGLVGNQHLERLPRQQNLIPVLASETWSGPLPCAERLPACVLSLDLRDGRPIGQARLRVPPIAGLRIILMCLDRMGTPRGPDVERLVQQHHVAPGHRYFVAGGVRDAADLEHLRTRGAAGVLVASALHEGRLSLP